MKTLKKRTSKVGHYRPNFFYSPAQHTAHSPELIFHIIPRLICLLICGETPAEKAERQKQYFMLFWIIQGLVFPKVRLGLIILENMDTNKMILQMLLLKYKLFYSYI